MAKKKTSLDDLSFDDLDLDFDFGGQNQRTGNTEINGKDRNPVVKATTNALKGVRNTVANKSFISHLMRLAMPKGFVDAYDTSKRVATKGRELYNGVQQDIAPAARDLDRATRQVLPYVRKKGHNSLADNIDKILGKTKGMPNPNQPNFRELDINQALLETFRAEAYDKAQAQDQDAAKQQLKDRTEEKRHQDSMSQTSVIADAVSSMAGYQRYVTNKYQRKMLEIQYRQYFTQRDTLAAIEAYAKDTHTQLDAIVKNTALPDILKMQASEQFINMARQRTFGRVQQGVGNYFRNYIDNTFDNIGKVVNNAKDQFITGMSAASMGLEAYASQQEMNEMLGQEDLGLAGLVGRFGAEAAGRKLGGFLNRRLNSNRRVANAAAKSGYYAGNLSETLADLKNDRSFETGAAGTLKQLLRAVLPNPFERDKKLSMNDDPLAQLGIGLGGESTRTASYQEGVLGYLSRMLQSMESSRTGREVGRLVWNNDRKTFQSQSTRIRETGYQILNRDKVKSINSTADAMIARMDPEGKLSPEARQALRTTLIREADTGKSFNPERLATGRVNFNSTPEVHRELATFMGGRYGFDSAGNRISEARHYNQMTLDRSSFSALRDSMPDVYGTIHRMIAAGNIEDLRALGVIVRDPKDPTKDIINYDFIQQHLSGEGWNPTIDRIRKNAPGGGSKPSARFDNIPPAPPASNGTDNNLNANDRLISLLTDQFSNIDLLLRNRPASDVDAQQTELLARIANAVENGTLGGNGSDDVVGGRTRFGLGRTLRRGLTGAWNLGKRTLRGYGSLLSSVGRGAWGLGSSLFGRAQEIFDVYVKGQLEPALTAAKMRAGEYRDFTTGEVIKKFSDIKGAVIDSSGKVVLTLEDIKNGLLTTGGKSIPSGLLRSVLGVVGKGIKAYVEMPLHMVRATKSLVTGALGLVGGIIAGPEDVYVKGEDTPRLLAVIMRRGGYRSKATLRPINKPSDIDGEVIDNQGNLVLSNDDLTKGIVDNRGRPIAGLGGKLLRMVGSAFGLVGGALNLARKAGSYVWEKTKSAGRGVKRLLSAGWNAVTKGINFSSSMGMGENGTATIMTGLEAIYNLLDARLPETKSFRKGSWQEQFSNRRKSTKEVKKDIEKASDSNPLLKYMMMFGGAVMSGFAWLKGKLTSLFANKATSAALDVAGALGDAAGGSKGKGGLLRKAARVAVKGGKLLGRGAVAAARFGGAALLPWLGEGIAAIGAAISAPVVAVVAGIAAVGAAGYFTYKYFKERPEPLQRLRLAEYGFDPSSSSDLKRILEIEGFLLQYTTASGGKASIGKFSPEELLKRAEVSGDPTAQRKFSEWYMARFRPVFLRNVGVLNQIEPNVNLLEVDDKLEKGKRVDFAEASRFNDGDPSNPYGYNGQPWGDDPLMTGTKIIDAEIADIRFKWKRVIPKYKADEYKTPQSAATQNMINAAAPPWMRTPEAVKPKGPEPQPAGKFQKSTDVYFSPGTTGGSFDSRITVKDWSPQNNRMIDDLTAVRMKVYGLTTLDVNMVNALTTLEMHVYDYLKVSGKGEVTLSASPDEIYAANAGIFGRNPADPQQKQDWLVWFNQRFLPVYSQFVSACFAINRAMAPAMAWKYLKAADMLSICELLKGVTYKDSSERPISVWLVKISPFVGIEANTDVSSIDQNLLSLRNQIRDDVYKEKQVTGQGSTGGGTSSSNLAAAGFNGGSNNRSGRPITYGMGGGNDLPGGVDRSGMYPGGRLGGGAPVGGMGPSVEYGKGTGGSVNDIPSPSGKGWDAMKATIVAAAKMTGVDPGLMAAMAGVESNFNPVATPGTSSAQGLYQFISSTWKAMVSKYGSKYGIPANASPNDPRANALMAAEYMKENQSYLEGKLGRPVTATDLYLAHFLGSGGAVKLLSAPSGDSALMHVTPGQAKANAKVFYAGGRPRTVGEIVSWANKRIEVDNGKYISEAKTMAGSSSTPAAANDSDGATQNTAPGATTSPSGGVTPMAAPGGSKASPDDGSAAYQNTLDQAAAAGVNNAGSMDTPVAQPKTQTSAGTTTPMPAPSGVPAQPAAAVTQAKANDDATASRMTASNDLLDVNKQQLAVQQEMSESLKQLLKMFADNPGSLGGGANDTNNPAAAQGQAAKQSDPGVGKLSFPISMKRTASK